MSDRFLLCPDTVSDRPVTNRGVHLGPSGYQPWMETADYWLDLLVSMGMSWVVLYSASDACIQSGAVEALLEAGVIPIIRFTYQFPRPWVEGETVKRLVRIYNRYDLKPLVIFGNEPFDDREWVVRVPPEETAWQIISKRWEEMARDTINAGALPGFPDGPCYSQNPFLKMPVITTARAGRLSTRMIRLAGPVLSRMVSRLRGNSMKLRSTTLLVTLLGTSSSTILACCL